MPELRDARIINNTQVTPTIWDMTLEFDELKETPAPGQFINVKVPLDASQILRIPLSYYSASSTSISLAYAVVGKGTAMLTKLRSGDRVSINAPLGKGWPAPLEGHHLLVAGGIGVTPIMARAQMIQDAGYSCDVVVGAQSADKLFGLSFFESLPAVKHLVVATDDGSQGVEGFVTTPVESLLNEQGVSYVQASTCGPQPMMCSLARICAEHDLPLHVSLERMMGCGFGACGTCNVESITGAYLSCCKAGPVFPAEVIKW